MQAFYQQQGMKQSSWLRACVARMRDAAALHGREHLAAALQRLGFPLR
jgi:hypothetical protein